MNPGLAVASVRPLPSSAAQEPSIQGGRATSRISQGFNPDWSFAQGTAGLPREVLTLHGLEARKGWPPSRPGQRSETSAGPLSQAFNCRPSGHLTLIKCERLRDLRRVSCPVPANVATVAVDDNTRTRNLTRQITTSCNVATALTVDAVAHPTNQLPARPCRPSCENLRL